MLRCFPIKENDIKIFLIFVYSQDHTARNALVSSAFGLLISAVVLQIAQLEIFAVRKIVDIHVTLPSLPKLQVGIAIRFFCVNCNEFKFSRYRGSI